MKIFLIVSSALTALLWLSTMICGLWVRSQDLAPADQASSLSFHSTLGVIATVAGVLTLGLVMMYLIRK